MEAVPSILLLMVVVSGHRVAATNLYNIARNKPTQQVSTYPNAGSELAVDGNYNADFAAGSCSHTFQSTNNWWAIDLLGRYPVHSVQITNRINEQHLQDFHIYISNTNPIPQLMVNPFGLNNDPLCASFPGVFPLQQTLHCHDVTVGRYLYIIKAIHEKLCMCEVEVRVEDWDVTTSARFSKTKGMRMLTTPLVQMSNTTSRSVVECGGKCTRAMKESTTWVQFQMETRLCQCLVWTTAFSDPAPALEAAVGWDLLEWK